ncbi:hypothetical protein [Pseudorhizobium flavum]|uniref:hypothetical protein n=1 Tax=Pseudorhizobium flavum TaxID=1335061 RepID=UPI003770641F
MPFYLVKQTLLIEAESEGAAAKKAVAEMLSVEEMRLEVKLDDANRWFVQVPVREMRAPEADVNARTALDERKLLKPAEEPVMTPPKLAKDHKGRTGNGIIFSLGLFVGLSPALLCLLM